MVRRLCGLTRSQHGTVRGPKRWRRGGKASRCRHGSAGQQDRGAVHHSRRTPRSGSHLPPPRTRSGRELAVLRAASRPAGRPGHGWGLAPLNCR
jgi:hypothetical protein